MSLPIRLVTVLAVLFLVAGCTSDDDAADEIHGAWLWERYSVYEEFAEDGTWGVWSSASAVGNPWPYDWGTYTFDGETLVYTNAEGSFCDGAVATFTVEFSDNGQEARETFVEDSCTTSGVVRAQNKVLVRQTP